MSLRLLKGRLYSKVCSIQALSAFTNTRTQSSRGHAAQGTFEGRPLLAHHN